MMTAEQYRASLNDGRETFFGGEQIFDLPGHPILGQTVESAARGYDRFYDPTPGAVGAFMKVPGFGAGTARAGRTARVGGPAHPRHLRIDHDAADGRRPHRADAAGKRRAHPRVRQRRPAARHPHHPVHHRRQRRPQPPAGPAGRSGRIRARRQPQAGRHRHPRREAAHLGGVDGSRADDDPDEGDEGGRSRLLGRVHGPGQRAGREDRQHHLRAAPRRQTRLPDVGPATTRRKAS